MKKTIFLLAGLVLTSAFAMAQSVDDGIKFLYYGKNKSAQDALQKVVDKNAKDGRAIYWLGQAMIADDNIAGAKTVYQTALTAGVNDPYVLVGMGNVELLEGGDVNSAKQKFEQAITQSKDKKGKENPDVLNAIGRANASGGSKVGDPVYAIEKLKRALELDPKSADIDINLGINYLKQGSDKGGEAVQAFQDAIVRDPKNAKAMARIGLVYQSQDNKPSMEEWYGKAIAADPTYAPVYYYYFNYYENRDINAAQEFLNKYVANADQDCNTNYFKANYLFRAGKYAESKAAADAMAAGECKNFPKINVLYAYNYDRLGDSVNAKSYLEKYFASAVPSTVDPDYYILASKVYSKFPGNEDTASAYLEKAIDVDTVKANKVKYAKTGADLFAKAGRVDKQLYWLQKSATLQGNASISESDYYKLSKGLTDALVPGDTVALARNFAIADSVTNAYITAYPAKPQGYTFRVIAGKKADLDSTKGLAIPAIEQQNVYLLADTAVNSKKVAFNNYYYLLIYYTQYAKGLSRAEGYQKAIEIADKMTAIYPDATSEENQFATKTKTSLKTALQRYEAQRNAAPPTTRPRTTQK